MNNEVAILAVFLRFVSETLKRPVADLEALILTENKEIKPNALELLSSLDVERVKMIQSSIDVEKTDVFKTHVGNKKREIERKYEDKIKGFETEIKSLKDLQSADQLRITARDAELLEKTKADIAAAEKKYNDYYASVEAEKRDFRVDNTLFDAMEKIKASYLNAPTTLNAKKMFLGVAKSDIGDVVLNADNSFSHFTKRDGTRLLKENGWVITPDELMKKVFTDSDVVKPLVQPPISGSGNTTETNPVFKGW